MKDEATIHTPPTKFLDNPPPKPEPAPPAPALAEPEAEVIVNTPQMAKPDAPLPAINPDAMKLAQLFSQQFLQMPQGLPMMGMSNMLPQSYPMPYSVPNWLFSPMVMPPFNAPQYIGPTNYSGYPQGQNLGTHPNLNYGAPPPLQNWGALPPAPNYAANHKPRRAHDVAAAPSLPISSSPCTANEPPISHGTRRRSNNQDPTGSSDGEMDSPVQFPNILEWLQQLNVDASRNPDGIEYTQYADLLRQNGITNLGDMTYLNSDQLQALGLNVGIATRLLKWSVDYRDKQLRDRRRKRAKFY